MRKGISVTAVAALLAVPALAGCSFFDEAEGVGACDWMTAGSAGDAGRTIVLLDRSASTAGATGPDYVSALGGVVHDAVEAGHVVYVGTFDGTASTVRWIAEGWVTDRGRNKESNREADRDTARTCLRTELKRAAAVPAKAPGTDVLGAIAVAGQELAGTEGDRRIAVATDGLATTGCADLTRVTVGDLAMIGPIDRLCRERGLPDLSGTAVTLLGVGHPGDGHPVPSTLQLEWLASLWSTLCESLRASCAVSTTPVAEARVRTAADAPPDPVVSFPPAERGVRQADGSVVYRLDSSVLFTPNDWTLSAAGRSELTAVAADIAKRPAPRVTVDGYTEAQASAQANRTLAQRRANVVRSFLAGLGVHVARATGHAGTAPGCPAPAADDRSRQCNRRVDVVAAPGSGTP
ncbi:MAG TPA: OmpA family protein [Actinophytocola sp.]|nr:OmpA family protein [Actinophytocola sp.]